jgi:hypothetical protein
LNWISFLKTWWAEDQIIAVTPELKFGVFFATICPTTKYLGRTRLRKPVRQR